MNNKDFYLGIAQAVAARSSCLKTHYGAVVVRDDRLVSIGYNAPAAGILHCRSCSRTVADHGEDYDSRCPAVHAEENAIINAGRAACLGGDIYIWGQVESEPCYRCMRIIRNAGIKNIITERKVISL